MIGFKIYYENQTGNVILTIPENHNAYAKEATKKQDFLMFDVLQSRNEDAIDFVQLEYGKHREDFKSANSWKVNLLTKEILFQYPSFDSAYSTQIDRLNAEIGVLLIESALDKARIAELEKAQGELLIEIALLKLGGNE